MISNQLSFLKYVNCYDIIASSTIEPQRKFGSMFDNSAAALHSPSMSCVGKDGEVLRVLEKYYGYKSLRDVQTSAVQELLAGNDILVTAPTGFGKSICFQLPALVRYEGNQACGSLAIIVCPLISLLHNQVEALKKRRVPCALLSSSESPAANRRVLDSLVHAKGRLPFALLYVTAERLVNDSFLSVLSNLHKSGRLALIAIDEAHCISEVSTAWPPYCTPVYL